MSMIGLQVEKIKSEIQQLKGQIYNIERQRIKSRFDMDKLEVLKSGVVRLEEEVERVSRW